MEDNPLGELCQGVVDISKCNIQNCEYSLSWCVTQSQWKSTVNIHYTAASSSLVQSWAFFCGFNSVWTKCVITALGFVYTSTKSWFLKVCTKFGSQISLGLSVFLFVVKNGKYGKPHAVTLQDQDEDSLQFDLTAGSLEELFEWYKVAWDIIQRTANQQYSKDQQVSAICFCGSRARIIKPVGMRLLEVAAKPAATTDFGHLLIAMVACRLHGRHQLVCKQLETNHQALVKLEKLQHKTERLHPKFCL